MVANKYPTSRFFLPLKYWNLNLWDLHVPSYCSKNVEHPSSFSICQWISFDEDYVIDKWRSNMIYTQRPSHDYFACNCARENVSRIRESEFFVSEMLSPREDKEEKEPLVLCWLSEIHKLNEWRFWKYQILC